MTALVARQEPYRALQVFDVVPAGHTAILVENDRWAPHLNAGEFAVIDVEDKSRERGELYLYLLERSSLHKREMEILPTIVQICMRGFAGCEIGVWMRFHWKRPGRLNYVDGPLGFEHWPEKCGGRVVGVLVPARNAA